MYILIYKNGLKMRVADKEMQKVVQNMHEIGVDHIELIYELDKKKEVKKINAFVSMKDRND